MLRSLICRAMAGAFALVAALGGGLAAQEYQLQAGDQIEVSVLEDPGLNRSVLIRPDGRISLPLAGSIVAEGLTPEALQAAIRRALARDFVEPPTVTVSLIGQAPKADDDIVTIYVVGEVNRPGSFEARAPVDVLQALALSGGPSPFAAERRIQIRRQSAQGGAVVFFDYRQVADGAVPVLLEPLGDGDVIVVPQRTLFE